MDRQREEIEKHWKYGYIWLSDKKKGFVNEQTINYITKYVTKVDLDHKEYKPIILCSKGIGKKYITSTSSENTKFNNDKTKDYYTTRSGHKIALPIYYRNNLYTEEEREKLWLHKLDQETRYVGGEKIDISKSTQEYNRLLKWYQRKNKQLGYGDNRKNWDLIKYEKQRRILNYRKRLNQETEEIDKIETEVLKQPKVLEWDELEKTVI